MNPLNELTDYQFDIATGTPLCGIMTRCGSDKGHHNYTTLYHFLFKDIRLRSLRIFEMGIGTNNQNIDSNMGPNGIPGASLHGWSEYFPNSHVYGADIDRDVLFFSNRINTFYVDQTSSDEMMGLWEHPSLSDGFDIIVDDGLHTPSATQVFFESSQHKLNPGGYFIIEDIHNDYVEEIHKKIENWRLVYPHLNFIMGYIPLKSGRASPFVDNNVVVIRRSTGS